jgi:hypothetical protein
MMHRLYRACVIDKTNKIGIGLLSSARKKRSDQSVKFIKVVAKISPPYYTFIAVFQAQHVVISGSVSILRFKVLLISDYGKTIYKTKSE